MPILMFGMDYSEALKFANSQDDFGWYEKLLKAGYDKKKLILKY